MNGEENEARLGASLTPKGNFNFSAVVKSGSEVECN